MQNYQDFHKYIYEKILWPIQVNRNENEWNIFHKLNTFAAKQTLKKKNLICF